MAARVVVIILNALISTRCLLGVRMNVQKTNDKNAQVAQNNVTSVDSAGFRASTAYCYEKSNFAHCWSSKPGNAPVCSASSGTTICLCPEHTQIECDVGNLNGETPSTGRCANKIIYVRDGEVHKNSRGQIDITGQTQETYCHDMRLNDQWKEKGLIAQESDGPSSMPKNDSYWDTCPAGYVSKDGECYRKKRFLGESCGGTEWVRGGAAVWDNWVRGGGSELAGQCAGSDTTYDEYSTACYEGTCVPFSFVNGRQECSCAWSGWNFLVSCSAADDKCGGHACVLSAGNGKKYCDYATSQDWNSLR